MGVASRGSTITLPCGVKRVNFFRVQVHFERGHELARIAHLALPLDQLPQPGDALIVIAPRPAPAFLVFPVRRDAFLGDAMHFLRADLHFEVPPAGPHHGRMQRLIQDSAAESR